MTRIDLAPILIPVTRWVGLTLIIAVTAGCGGADDNGYDEAAAAAQAKTTEARSLGVKSPCSETSQCGLLRMHDWIGPCANYFYEPYSLVASTAAAASAAAAAQVQLAVTAASLGPNSSVLCAAFVPTPPTPQCVVSVCSAVGQ